MEEDCGGGQGLTKGCGAKGRRRITLEREAESLITAWDFSM
jgi:hypothetical protein